MAEKLEVSNNWMVFNFCQVLNCRQVVWCKILVLLKDISSKSKLSGQVHKTWYIISGGRILRNSGKWSTPLSIWYKMKAVSVQKAWREAWWSEEDSEERVTCMASISSGCSAEQGNLKETDARAPVTLALINQNRRWVLCLFVCDGTIPQFPNWETKL